MIKIIQWNDYFLTLSYENGHKLKLISKNILQVKKTLMKEQNNKESAHVYNMSLLKHAEMFNEFDLSGIEHVKYIKQS